MVAGVEAAAARGLPLADRNCGDLKVRFEGPGLVGLGDVRGAGDEVRTAGVLAPGPGLELAERLGCSTSWRERALDGERHGVVFGVIDPAVAASGDDQGVPYPMRTYARTRGVSDYLSQLSRIDDCPCCGWRSEPPATKSTAARRTPATRSRPVRWHRDAPAFHLLDRYVPRLRQFVMSTGADG
jgi:hypothetical protein